MANPISNVLPSALVPAVTSPVLIREEPNLVQGQPTQAQRGGLFVRLLFETRTVAHMLHLSVPSYSKHMFLDEFYKNIIPAADAYAEAYISRCGPITNWALVTLPAVAPLQYFQTCRQWIDNNREQFGDHHKEIASLIDDILKVFDSVIYKLENLA